MARFLMLSRTAHLAYLANADPTLAAALDPLTEAQWGVLKGYLFSMLPTFAEDTYNMFMAAGGQQIIAGIVQVGLWGCGAGGWGRGGGGGGASDSLIIRAKPACLPARRTLAPLLFLPCRQRLPNGCRWRRRPQRRHSCTPCCPWRCMPCWMP